MNLLVHHAILHSFDPSNDLFECSQKFTAYRGYMNRTSREFTRPEDHCYEVEEVFDEDGDCTLSVCKTDGDHMLGYKFNNVFSLWKCNHQVNTWFHYTRDRANSWLHPYYNLKYGSSNDPSRTQPPYFDSLPATLTPTPTQHLYTWEESFGELVEYKTREGHCRVQRNYRTPDGYNLGKWLANQKQKKRKGDLDPDLEIRMTDLGVKWRK